MLVKTPQLLAPRANERPSSTSGWTDAEVISRGERLPEHKRKPPAEINTLLYMFQSSFQIPLCFLYCSVSIPVPIVTRLHGNSCVILAEAMIWSSRRSSWTLPRGPDLRGSSANPHQGAEALQIICVNFYGKCLCKVMHIDLHLCFMQGWRYACARWTSISFGRCWAFIFFNVWCSVFDPEFEHLHGVQSRTAPSLCLCTLWFGRTGLGLSSVSRSHVSFVNFLCWLLGWLGGGFPPQGGDFQRKPSFLHRSAMKQSASS